MCKLVNKHGAAGLFFFLPFRPFDLERLGEGDLDRFGEPPRFRPGERPRCLPATGSAGVSTCVNRHLSPFLHVPFGKN